MDINEKYRKDADTLTLILNSFETEDFKEKKDIEIIKSLLESKPQIISSSCETGHITGSALVVDIETGLFLVHLHKKLGKWLQFGGHADTETNPADVALRESLEETGIHDLFFYPLNSQKLPIDIEIQFIPEYKGKAPHYHYDFRYLLATKNSNELNLKLKNESNDFKWINSNEISQLNIDHALARLIYKAEKILKETSH